MISAIRSSAHLHLHNPKPIQTETIAQRAVRAVIESFQSIVKMIQSAYDAFTGYFSEKKVIKKPLLTPTPPPTPTDKRIFYENDYTGYSEDDIRGLQFAENCCRYPKFALAASKERAGLGLRQACKILNIYLRTFEVSPPLQLSSFFAWLDRKSP